MNYEHKRTETHSECQPCRLTSQSKSDLVAAMRITCFSRLHNVVNLSKPDNQARNKFKNMCGHKSSQGVENMLAALQNHGNPAVWKTSVAHLQKQSKLALFFARWQKFCRQNGPPFGVQKRTPKWRSFTLSRFDLLVSGRLGLQTEAVFVGEI